MIKQIIIFTLTLSIVCSCNQDSKQNDNESYSEFKYKPSEPYHEFKIDEYWINKFDQRGLQNAFTSDDKLYVNTINISKGDNFLYCLSLKNGKVVWKHKVDTYASQPISINKNRIYFSTYVGDIYAFTKDGQLVWTNKLNSSYAGHVINQINNNLIVSSISNGIYEFDVSSGELVKHYEKGKGNTIPVFSGDRMIYSTHEYNSNPNILKCLDYKTGKIEWEVSTDMQLEKALSTKNEIIAHDMFSGIYCFDLETGKAKWSQNFDNRDIVDFNIVSDDIIWYRAYNEQGFIEIDSGKKVEFNFEELKQNYHVTIQNESYRVEVKHLLNTNGENEINIKKTTGNNIYSK
jgi:outer membrane protein assembly factor BamB